MVPYDFTRWTFKQRQLDGVWLGNLLQCFKHLQLNRTINKSKRQEVLIALSQDGMKINHRCFEVNVEKELKLLGFIIIRMKSLAVKLGIFNTLSPCISKHISKTYYCLSTCTKDIMLLHRALC